METFLHDLRYGFRVLLSKPGFTIVAVLALAIGIGHVRRLLDARIHRLGDVERREDRHLGQRRQRRREQQDQTGEQPQGGGNGLGHRGKAVIWLEVAGDRSPTKLKIL